MIDAIQSLLTLHLSDVKLLALVSGKKQREILSNVLNSE